MAVFGNFQGLEGRLVVVQPPKPAVKLGLCTKEERWIVRKALYGLAESPAAWVEWRDQRLQGMSWVSKDGQAMSFQRSNADPSLFLIMAQEKPEGASKLVGTMGLHVNGGEPALGTSLLNALPVTAKTGCAPEFQSDQSSDQS